MSDETEAQLPSGLVLRGCAHLPGVKQLDSSKDLKAELWNLNSMKEILKIKQVVTHQLRSLSAVPNTFRSLFNTSFHILWVISVFRETPNSGQQTDFKFSLWPERVRRSPVENPPSSRRRTRRREFRGERSYRAVKWFQLFATFSF